MNKIIKFYADWCAPCKVLSSQIETLKLTDYIESVNIEVTPELTKKYSVRSIPTLISVSPDGVVLKRHTGSISDDSLEEFVHG